MPASDDHHAAPFVKWAGGKSDLLDQYDALFPADPVETYYEPFAGSGAVFFHLRRRDIARRYCLSDLNGELVNAYCVIRDCVDALIVQLAEHRAQHSREHYYRTRRLDRKRHWRESADSVERAARLIYLNKTCYNGLWRVNSRGEFNVPMGSYDHPNILDEHRLVAASRALQGVDVRSSGFAEAVAGAGAGDFVYFDPPYVPVSQTASFTGYYRGGFSADEQRALAATFRDLTARGCRVMLSNSDVPFVRDLYADYRIETVTARRRINSDATQRGPISEVVVLSY